MKADDFKNGTYQVGKVVGVVSARVEGQRTSPPDRYTEDSLLADMTSAHKFASDANERAVLSEISGLGTSRTRAAIIANLIGRGLLTLQSVAGRGGKKKGVIVSSQEGRTIARYLPAALTSVATTAKWELGFRLVEQGKATPEQMQAHLDRTLVGIVEDAKKRGSGGVLDRAKARARTRKRSKFLNTSGPFRCTIGGA
ncbi:MAG: topoisomerase [Ramlibacter sp.]|jgi:DNA topoisomerase-3|nr:topoisomerase [Ramlibacter sp.]